VRNGPDGIMRKLLASSCEALPVSAGPQKPRDTRTRAANSAGLESAGTASHHPSMPPAIQIENDFEIPFSREEVWPILSKTDWINRSLGLPPITYDIHPRKEGGSSIIARAKLLGWELRWQELPFEFAQAVP